MKFNKLYGLLIALFVILVVGVVAQFEMGGGGGELFMSPDPGHNPNDMDWQFAVTSAAKFQYRVGIGSATNPLGKLHVRSDNGKAYEFTGAILAAHAGTRCNCDDDENEFDCDELPTESIGTICYDWYFEPPAQPLSRGYEVVADTVPSNLLFVADDGKVGIGTPSPTMKLDVNGNVNVDGDINLGAATSRYKVRDDPLDLDCIVAVGTDSGSSSAKAYCPADRWVLGGGCRYEESVGGNWAYWRPYDSAGNVASTTTKGGSYRCDSSDSDEYIYAYAICCKLNQN